MKGRILRRAIPILGAMLALAACTRHAMETPIISNSQQPDKELYDRSVSEMERARYTPARLLLQTLINTYPDSEYLAKAKLAIADSWYRQGGDSNLLQAEAEYKDFITFFPMMPEASEAQMRVAMIQYREMEKPDRDSNHARRAEQEFQKMLLTYPDSPFAAEAEQRLREVQEVLAEGAYEIARFYYLRSWDKAAQPRLKDLVERYPNFSEADDALFMLGQSLERSQKKGSEAVAYYANIVRSYPLSDHAAIAKKRLTALGAPVPPADPVAVARMTYEEAHAEQEGKVAKAKGMFQRRPNIAPAQGKIGPPTMTAFGPAQPGSESAMSQSGPDAAPASTPALSLEQVPGTSSDKSSSSR